jgi:pimeloyl-ACP methyl ester carboxylesterase
LPLAIASERRVLSTPVGKLSLYHAQPPQGAGVLPPVLLVHSVNAAASAAEVAPLFAHYRQTRAVYALELPGFGFSDRSARAYTPRLMTDALHGAVAHIRAEHGGVAVDVLAVSLAAEFAARAACEAPQSIRRLALVSPTGFRGRRLRHGPPGSTLGMDWLYRLFTWQPWREGIFSTLTRPGVVRYFLQRTWGAKTIDEDLWRYCVLTARQPGASNAPFYFVSAFLFSADINTLYESLQCPVWVSMATRGDFTDYRLADSLQGRANWQWHRMEGGALPYFEDLSAFTRALDPFWVDEAAAH